MMIESYCDYAEDRVKHIIMCPIVIHGSSHLHTECRACKHNFFDFYTTLAVIRKKMSTEDPIWEGVLPELDENIRITKNESGKKRKT